MLKPLLEIPVQELVPIKATYTSSSTDGEYLMRRGTFQFFEDPREWSFEQYYKKVDGKYLLYYDLYEYNP
jgi:hypothetical protein